MVWYKKDSKQYNTKTSVVNIEIEMVTFAFIMKRSVTFHVQNINICERSPSRGSSITFRRRYNCTNNHVRAKESRIQVGEFRGRVAGLFSYSNGVQYALGMICTTFFSKIANRMFVLIISAQPIWLSTNFMTLIPSLTFTELRLVFMEHLQRVWHASRKQLPFRTPGPPFFLNCLCSNCWDRFLELAVFFLDFSRWLPLGTLSILLIAFQELKSYYIGSLFRSVSPITIHVKWLIFIWRHLSIQ